VVELSARIVVAFLGAAGLAAAAGLSRLESCDDGKRFASTVRFICAMRSATLGFSLGNEPTGIGELLRMPRKEFGGP
jgi:hypothetical protein